MHISDGKIKGVVSSFGPLKECIVTEDAEGFALTLIARTGVKIKICKKDGNVQKRYKNLDTWVKWLKERFDKPMKIVVHYDH